jgi:cbb3-type cytochrome oxidase maturation protein
MDLNSIQLTTLCVVFVGLHLLALPAFVWALRGRQFSGRQQSEWSLEDSEAPPAPMAVSIMPRRARWMLGILGTMAVLMLASVLLVMFVALQATAHPVTGKCPFQ